MTLRPSPVKLAVSMLCLIGSGAWATEYGTVASSTPLVVAVPIPQRQCTDEQVSYQQPTTGAGAVIGAIAGAAIGNSIGSGAGRAAATGIGLIAGSEIGNRAEANAAQPVTGTVQRCRTVTRYENRTIAYDVVYDYQGVRRRVRMAQDPGERIALEVNVAPAGAMAPGRVAAAQPAPVYTEPQAEVVYEPAPPPMVYAPPAYYYGPQPYYVNPWPLLAVGIGLGWHGGGGWGGHGYGHRR